MPLTTSHNTAKRFQPPTTHAVGAALALAPARNLAAAPNRPESRLVTACLCLAVYILLLAGNCTAATTVRSPPGLFMLPCCLVPLRNPA